MKVVVALVSVFFTLLAVFNVFSGIVAGIWLIVLGEWGPIILGLIAFLSSTFMLSLVLAPSFLLLAPAAYWAEKGNTLATLLFSMPSMFYTLAVATVWCSGVLVLFVGNASNVSLVPTLMWSYGVATGPWAYMAAKDDRGGDSPGSSLTAALIQLAYLVVAVLTVRTTITDWRLIPLFVVLMAVVFVIQVLVSFLLLRETIQRDKDTKMWAESMASTDMGNSFSTQGTIGDGLGEGNEAPTAVADSALAHYGLGWTYWKQGAMDEAIKEYTEALKINPAYAEVHISLAVVLRDQGKLDEAMVELREALRIDPDSSLAHHNLGWALSQQGKLDEAAEEYRAALATNPHDAGVHHNLGWALSQQGKLDEAMVELREALRIDPNYTLAHYSLGISLQALKRDEEALDSFRVFVEAGSEQNALQVKYAEDQIRLIQEKAGGVDNGANRLF